jgi:hypothetical protein
VDQSDHAYLDESETRRAATRTKLEETIQLQTAEDYVSLAAERARDAGEPALALRIRRLAQEINLVRNRVRLLEAAHNAV